MAHPPRTHPLRAAETPSQAAPDRGAGAPRTRLRSVLLALGIGTGVGVAGVAMAFSIIAIPLFIVASTEPGSGVDRGLVRKGLFHIALPFGLVAGVGAGVLVGVWYARGGRLPTDRTPIHGR